MNQAIKLSKICPVCKRIFTNRKKWEKRGVWENVKYCSDKCRRTNTKLKIL